MKVTWGGATVDLGYLYFFNVNLVCHSPTQPTPLNCVVGNWLILFPLGLTVAECAAAYTIRYIHTTTTSTIPTNSPCSADAYATVALVQARSSSTLPIHAELQHTHWRLSNALELQVLHDFVHVGETDNRPSSCWHDSLLGCDYYSWFLLPAEFAETLSCCTLVKERNFCVWCVNNYYKLF